MQVKKAISLCIVWRRNFCTNCCVSPSMGAMEFRDLVGLGLRSPRSPEGHTTGLITTQLYNTGIYFRIYNIHLYTCLLLILSSRVSAKTLWRIALRFAALISLTFESRVSARLHSRTRVFAYYMPGRPNRDPWFQILWLTASFFLSVSFNLILWDTGRLERLLPNADSRVPCPQFGCKRRNSEWKFLACIFVIINLVLNFLIFELGFAFLKHVSD